ncbi:MAG: hypothetical protein Q8Q28_10735 [Pseudomonadota bacterium]|nr:hypothetical protein [Pseudomonadota bacterium]
MTYSTTIQQHFMQRGLKLRGLDARVPESLDELALQGSLVRTYKKMRDLIQDKKLPESRHFAYMVNNLAQAGVGEVNYVQALYQMYWHGLVPASFGQFKERESDKGKRQHFLQMFCNFNFDTTRFRAAPSGQDDFLYQLALTIYPYSFQG